MKIAVLPAPNGMPERMGQIQCTGGVHVQANQSSPMGANTAAMQITLTMASGGTLPVSGSTLWEFIIRRSSGSEPMTIKQPTASPVKARPERPEDQPRRPLNTIG